MKGEEKKGWHKCKVQERGNKEENHEWQKREWQMRANWKWNCGKEGEQK